MRIGGLAGLLALVSLLAPGAGGAGDLVFPPGGGQAFHWQGYAAFDAATDLAGQELTITGPWIGADKDLIETVLAYFEAATGARVTFAGSGSFEQDIVIAAEAGTPPDIAVIPQPGLAADLAARGHLVPLGQDTADWVRENYAAGQSWVDLATHPDPGGVPRLYGLFYRVDLKSLVWYAPEAFAEAGYAVPATLEDLRSLTARIAADGGTPWCLGLGSGAATGWPATDWVEDLLLRREPPEVYDAWVRHDIPFDDPRVLAAIEDYGWFARTPGFVAGGAAAAATTDFRDSAKGLFDLPPRCYLHRQASFIPTFFGEGVEVGQDAAFFPFPAPADGHLGQPVLGSGTQWAIMKDSPAARALIEFLKLPIAHEVWMAQSGFLTPFKGANPDAYASDALRAQGEILLNATTFRFDGSDLMPAQIGADAFWTGMVDYTAGADAETVARAIEARWSAMR